MPPFTLSSLTIADGRSVGLNNVPAFWQDPAWRLIWTRVGKSLEYVTEQAAQRGSNFLFIDREHRRTLKVVDEALVQKGETGFVGCRSFVPYVFASFHQEWTRVY